MFFHPVPFTFESKVLWSTSILGYLVLLIKWQFPPTCLFHSLFLEILLIACLMRMSWTGLLCFFFFSSFFIFAVTFSPLFNCYDFWEVIFILSLNSQLNFYLGNYILNFHDLLNLLLLLLSYCRVFCFRYRRDISSSLPTFILKSTCLIIYY